MRFAIRSAAVAVLLLAGCGKESAPASGTAPTAPAALPADPPLAKLYQQTCMACHTKPGSGAPQSGVAADWQDRNAQGLDTLVDHTINGYKGMPPLGSCMDCSEDDFRALIRFMAGLS